MLSKPEMIATIRAAVANADRMAYEDDDGEERGCIHVLEALTPDASTDSLQQCCGTPLSYAALTRLVPPYRLKTMLRLFQRWYDTGFPYFAERIGFKKSDTHERMSALLEQLYNDGLFTMTPLEINGKQLTVIEFADAPEVMSRGQMRQAVRTVQLVQFRLHGEREQRIGRVLSTLPRGRVTLRADDTGEVWHVPYGAVAFDGLVPAHDLIDAVTQAHPSDDEPLTIVPLSGFDDDGEPEVRGMRDGSFEIWFNMMPPGFDSGSGEFDTFDKTLSTKLEKEVEWIDREVFRIADPGPDTLRRVMQYFAEFHMIVSSYKQPGWVDDDF